MPTRIVREGILTSEKVNSLSDKAELFYRRLMSVADDYGRYFSHPTLLRSGCYPLKIDEHPESDVKQMLSECVKAGLIRLYSGKYLEITNFGQQQRSKSKFPEPDDFKQQESPIKPDCLSNDNRVQIESESGEKQMLSLVGVGVGVGVEGVLPQTPSREGAKKGPLQLRAEKLMGRRVDTPLTRPEQRAFKNSEAAIKSTTEDQWKALERFYAAPQEETFARKDLATLVNNWNGEIDRAVAWAKSQKPNTSAAVTLVMVREYIEEKMPKNPNNPSWSATIFRAINEQKIDDWKLFTSTQIAKWRTQ